MWVLGPNLGPPQELQLRLTAETSVQTPSNSFILILRHS